MTATQTQLRRGSTTDHSSFTGAVGEVTVDTTKDTLVVHDGSTAGGFPLARADQAQPLDAALTSIAALGTAADKLLYTTGVDTFAEASLTAAARTVLDDATVAAMLATMGGAPLASPTFTGTPAAPTATAGTNTTQLATTAFVTTAVGAISGGSPGGSSGLVQYNNAGAFGAAANLSIDASGNPVLATSTPTTPASGSVSLYAADLAGRPMPAAKGPSGAASALAPHLGMARRMEWTAVNNSGTLGAYGGTLTTAGTATARAIAGGSYFSLSRRISGLSASSAGSSAEFRHNQLSYCLGDAAGAGGFTFVARFAIADAAAVANARMFAGFYGSAGAIASVDPSTLLNIIGVGCDAGGTNLVIMHNDGAGLATTVSLGANFPTNTRSTDVYELALYCPPNGSSVGYRVRRLNTGDELSGTLSSNLPAGATLLSPHVWRNNGSTALAVDIALMGLYVESDT
mgnify:FL=1